MTSAYVQGLEKNIPKYSWYKVFTKRLYLPLIAVQLVNVGQVTVGELALIAAITSVVSLLLQVPAGYIADRWGNRASIIFGAAVATPSALFYVFMPNFYGGLIASLLFFGGYAFQSGAIEAFMHDTLAALKREKDYSKVMGRAQSYGLSANIVLIALVPATYAVHPTLPFIIGFVSLVCMTWLTISFTYPKSDTPPTKKNPFAAAKNIVNAQNIILFLFAGILSAVANRAPEFRELFYQDIGISTSLFGILLAAGSLVGAIMGFYIHALDKLRPPMFYLFDLLVISLCLVLSGVGGSPIMAVLAFTLFTGYARVRMIIFQSKLLANLQHAYKATLLSTLSLFTLTAEIGAVAVLAYLVGILDYANGYIAYGLLVLGVGLALWGILLIELKLRHGRLKTNT